MSGASTSPILARRLEDETDNSPVRVSYIITTRNRGEYLRRTLLNVREFIGSEDELIIIDGGSTDSTLDVVQEHRDIVSILVSESDSSEGHAFNKGLSLARGRFIKSITDDDYFYPDAMRRLIAVAEQLSEVDAIQAGGEFWRIKDGEPKFIRFYRLADELKNPSAVDIFYCHAGLGLIVRRRTISKTGGISPGYRSADGDFHCKLVESKCDVRYLDINLYRHYHYDHSGINDSDRIVLDSMMFALRLREWDQFYGLKPRGAARSIGLDAQPEGVGFQFLIYFSHRIWRSKAKLLLHVFPILSDYVRFIQRNFRRLPVASLRAKRPELPLERVPDMPFTGKLLPKDPKMVR